LVAAAVTVVTVVVVTVAAAVTSKRLNLTWVLASAYALASALTLRCQYPAWR
jgi:hypothetical protein